MAENILKKMLRSIENAVKLLSQNQTSSSAAEGMGPCGTYHTGSVPGCGGRDESRRAWEPRREASSDRYLATGSWSTPLLASQIWSLETARYWSRC